MPALQFIARLLLLALALGFALLLLSLGLVVLLVWWVVAALTGRRKPQAKVWAQHVHRRAQGFARRRPVGEVVEAEVRELR